MVLPLRAADLQGTFDVGRRVRLALDPWIAIPASAIYLVSLIALYSVVYHPVAYEIRPELADEWSTVFTRQLMWGFFGISLMVWTALADLRTLADKTRWIYAAGLALLAAVLLFGVKVRNIKAWLSLGIVTFQPSELVKVALVIALARYLSKPRRLDAPIRSLVTAALIVGVPAAFVLKQPDMGTVLVYLSLLLSVPFASGLPSSFLILIVVGSSLAILRLMIGIAHEYLNVLPAGFAETILTQPGPAKAIFVIAAVAGSAVALAMRVMRFRHSLTVFLFCVVPPAAFLASFGLAEHLKEYQKMRLFSFIAPQLDPQGSGYNLIQSQIAVGSGQLLGRGLQGATQSTLGFLPERQTDFIFSVIGELFGFVGTGLVVCGFALLCLRILWVASQARSRFGALIAIGTTTILLSHAVVNIGMAVGLMPIMGIPLPLASYGGTAMVATFLLLGLVQAVERDARG